MSDYFSAAGVPVPSDGVRPGEQEPSGALDGMRYAAPDAAPLSPSQDGIRDAVSASEAGGEGHNAMAPKAEDEARSKAMALRVRDNDMVSNMSTVLPQVQVSKRPDSSHASLPQNCRGT